MAVRFMKTMSRTLGSVWLLGAAVGCGLDLRGEASADPRAVPPSSEQEGPTGCFPVLTGCVGVVLSGVYARLTCGDSTNCGPGWTCCAQFDVGGALTGSSCLPSCPTTGAAHLCTSSAPCGVGKSCLPLTSAPGFSTCQ
jgi:hypothetical protein